MSLTFREGVSPADVRSKMAEPHRDSLQDILHLDIHRREEIPNCNDPDIHLWSLCRGSAIIHAQ